MQPTRLPDYYSPQHQKANEYGRYYWCGAGLISFGISVFIPLNPVLSVESVLRVIASSAIAGCGIQVLRLQKEIEEVKHFELVHKEAQIDLYAHATGVNVDVRQQLTAMEAAKYLPQKKAQPVPVIQEQDDPEEEDEEVEAPSSPPKAEPKDPIGLIPALRDLGINAEWVQAVPGPVFVRYLVRLVNNGKKVQKISSVMALDEDIAAKLGVEFTPFISRDRDCVAIDVARPDPQIVPLELFIEPKRLSPIELKIPIGVDLQGRLIEADLSNPTTCHFLVGGTTGSGKSAWFCAVINSIRLRYSPDDVKLLLVDPKQVEFTRFEGLPWLLRSPIYSGEDCIDAMAGLVEEMESRYTKFRQEKVANIQEYLAKGHKLPRIVVLYDEFADFMVDPEIKKELEVSIKRLGAKARAAGIHLLIGTQRPDKDVTTPLIRSNLPARVCLMVASEDDSKIVLGGNNIQGKRLLGKGDLLFMPSGGNATRLQALYVTDWSALNSEEKESDRRDSTRVTTQPDEWVTDEVTQDGYAGNERVTKDYERSEVKPWEDVTRLQEAAKLFLSGEKSKTWVIKNILNAQGRNLEKGQKSFREYLATVGRENERSESDSANPDDKIQQLEQLLEEGVTDVNQQIDYLWPGLREEARADAIAVVQEMTYKIQSKIVKQIIADRPKLEWENRQSLPIDLGLFVVVNDSSEVLYVTCDESDLDKIERKITGQTWICHIPIQDTDNLQNYAMMYAKLLNSRWNNENN